VARATQGSTMTVGILGKKLGMTQLFQEDGTWIPVTVIQAGPCKVLQVKAKQASELPEDRRSASTNLGKKRGSHQRPRRDDGYYAVQLGFDDRNDKSASKPAIGHAKKAGTGAKWFVREIRVDAMPAQSEGDDVKVDAFEQIPFVDVTGWTKGRGWTGVIKRYGFQRQNATHGNSKATRKSGSLGRTFSTMKGLPKGKKMAGRHGTERYTVQNLRVVKVDGERNLMYIRGAIPGHRQGYLIVRDAIKKANRKA
jgi:large subunit ribosomal protein L3